MMKYSRNIHNNYKSSRLGIPLNELRIKFQDKIEKVKLELGGIDPTEELKQFLNMKNKRNNRTKTIMMMERLKLEELKIVMHPNYHIKY